MQQIRLVSGVMVLRVNKINNLQGIITNSVTNTPQNTITNPELTIFGKQYDVIEFPCLLIFFRIPDTLIQVSEKNI